MTDHKLKLMRARTRFKRVVKQVVLWWKAKDAKYHWKWRTANGVVAGIMLLSIITPVVLQLQANRDYHLSNTTLDLVGKTDPKLSSKLTYDAKTKTYQFNKESIKEFNPVDQLKQQVGTPQQDDKDKALYSLDVPKDMSKGVTYYDTNSQLSFKLLPQFNGREGKMQQERLVYPLGKDTQAVYTLKNNGLKEDIVVQKATKDTMKFSYTLELPKTLEARALDDGSGAIGIYSANPSLFGNISYGSDEDREKVEKARESGAKDTLVFGIPAPIITTAKGDDASKTKARFELKGQQLTVIAEGLTSLKQPFSIDPSVVVTSTSDFQTNGNNEGNIAFGSGNISRNTLSGGTLGAWHFTDNSIDRGTSQNGGSGAANGMITAAGTRSVVAYNGYIYAFGGLSGAILTNLVERAQINSNGTLGTWTADTVLPNAQYTSAVAYNGYMYIVGGAVASNKIADVYYATINTTSGALGSWTPTTSLNTTRRIDGGLVAYNGMMYVINGCTISTGGSNCDASSSPTAAVLCATINPNGTIGTWNDSCGTTNLTARYYGAAVAYNGYIYYAGGCSVASAGSCTTRPVTVQYAKINSDGTLATWLTATNNFTSAGTFNNAGLQVHRGYLYLTLSSGNSSTVQYAAINANADIGVWSSVNNTNATKGMFGFVAYQNYLYSVGGCTSAASNCTGNSLNGVEYVAINAAGVTDSSYTVDSGTSFTTSRMNHATAIYNGYLYISGGDSTGNGALLNDVQYAPINSDGSIGTWASAGTGFGTARYEHAMVVAKGYLYILGGINGGISRNDVQHSPINSNGTIGTWVNDGSDNLSTSLAGMQANVYGDYIYITGGFHTGGSHTTTVNSAQINPDGTLGTWDTSLNTFTAGRFLHQTVIANGYIYVMGGREGGATVISSVEYALLNASNGTVGTWQSATGFPSSIGRDRFGAASNKGYIYIAGGCTARGGLFNPCTSITDTGIYTKVNADGTLAGWNTATSLPAARQGHQTVASNDYFYFTGGCITAGCAVADVKDDVQYAQIRNGGNGTSGMWTRNTETAGGGNLWNGTAAYGNYVYNVGGCANPPTLGGRLHCGAASSLVISTPICDGTMSTGGCTSGTANVPGTNVNSGQPISGARYGLTSVAYNGYLYAIGGCTAMTLNGMNSICNTYASDVQYTPIGSNGTLGAWVSDPDAFSTARYGHTSAIYNGYLYIMGGCSAATVGTGNCATMQSDIQYALICTGSNNGVDGCGATAGQVGTWHSGASFNTARMYHASVAYNGYLYVIGGCTALSASVCTAFNSDVQSIQLNSDGSTNGSWTVNRSINGARFGLAAAAYNGHLYVTGGCSAAHNNMCSDNSAYNTVDISAIGANGVLDNWNTSATRLGATNVAHGLVVGAGNLIEVRGSRGFGTATLSIGIASLSTIPRKGLYSKLLTFNFSTSPRLITYNGTLANGTSDISYRGSSSGTSWTGSITGASSLTNARCPAPANNRYLQLFVTFDDTQRGTFPDETTDASNLTDLTLSYEFSRPPNQRLKLGKILQENLGQTDLDICKLVAQ